MHSIDYIIVGQGIAGSLLAYELLQRGQQIIIVNPPQIQSASSVAEAVINPYNIRKGAVDQEKAEMISLAKDYYEQLAADLDTTFVRTLPLLIFDGSDAGTVVEHCKLPSQHRYEDVIWVNARKVIALLKQYFIDKDVYKAEKLAYEELIVKGDHVTWKNFHAKKVIFCEGAQGKRNPLLAGLPFTHNRGDAIILDIADLPQDKMYEFETRLVPIGDGKFWMGSNHVWEYDNLLPNKAFMMIQFNKLKDWIDVPFVIRQQWVAERPTTAGQFPFIGFHPIFQSVGIFNGLGSKGFTWAPFYATRFADYIVGTASEIQDYDMEQMRRLW